MKKFVAAYCASILLILAFAGAASAAVVGINNPAIAYDSLSNRYLAVYAKSPDGVIFNIYGQLLKADGTAYSAEFAVSTASNGETLPAVAFDSLYRRFIVVWTDTRNSGSTGTDIYAKILYSDGTAYSSADFYVSRGSAATDDQTSPAVAYDAANGRYVVVWTDSRNVATTGSDIYARLVNPTGTLYGASDIQVSSASTDETEPAIEYDANNRRFLIAWEDKRNNATTLTDLYGRVMETDGTFHATNGVERTITTAANHQYKPSLAFDSANSRFLAAWTDYRDNATRGADVYAAVLTSTGLVTVTGFAVSDATDASAQLSAAAIYNSYLGRYLVAWHDTRNAGTGLDIYGQSIDVSGSLNGANFQVDASASNQANVAAAYNNTCGNSVIVYEDASASPQAFSAALEGTPCQALKVGCFIATAAYGSPLAPDVQTLREFRDRYLITNVPGRALVSVYYIVSPPAADLISKHDSLRVAARVALSPIIYSINHPMESSFAFTGLVALIAAICLKRRE